MADSTGLHDVYTYNADRSARARVDAGRRSMPDRLSLWIERSDGSLARVSVYTRDADIDDDFLVVANALRIMGHGETPIIARDGHGDYLRMTPAALFS